LASANPSNISSSVEPPILPSFTDLILSRVKALVRFGSFLENPIGHDALAKIALETERLGFDSVWLEDHLVVTPGSQYMKRHKVIPLSVMAPSLLECWTTLSWLAGQTHRIRLGTLVTCNLFRSPSLLAKMACTFDVLSNGRLELGLGAGYWKPEFEMYGIPLPGHRERIDRLAEGIRIVKSMCSSETADFAGKYYTVKEALNNPKPVQKPHPPITIGGRSTPVMKLAAQLADSWNFPAPFSLTAEEYAEIVGTFDDYCREAKRSPTAVVKSLGVRCLIDRNEKKARERARQFRPEWESMEDFMKRPIGTPEQIIEKLTALKDKGANYFIVHFYEPADLTALQLFAEEVIPAVR